MLCYGSTQGRTYLMKLAQTVCYDHMSTLFGQAPTAQNACPVEIISENIHIILPISRLKSSRKFFVSLFPPQILISIIVTIHLTTQWKIKTKQQQKYSTLIINTYLQRQEGDLRMVMMRFLTGTDRRHLSSQWAQLMSVS